jgi:YYY domain-containing protein
MFDLNFNIATIVIAIIIIGFFSIVNYKNSYFERFKKKDFLKYVIISELIFLFIFSLALLFKSFRPDLDHGEGPMDFAYINSILRSEKQPPPYPWLAGVNLENVYYYFGHFSYAILIKLSGVEPSKGYVLSLATVFSLIAVCSFSFAYNISKNYKIAFFCLFLITFGSSLLSILHLINSIYPEIDFHITGYKMSNENSFSWRFFYGGGLFWWSTRVIPWTITEFPWFSLLWGDLHAHYMSYSFIFVFSHLILDVLFSHKSGFSVFGDGFSEIIQKISVFSISLGYMFPQFIWNYPLYVGFLALSLFFIFYENEKRAKFLLYFISSFLIIFSLSVVFYFEPIKNLTELNPKRSSLNFEDLKTSLFSFTVLYGLQIFLISSYFSHKIYKSINSRLKKNVYVLFVVLYFILYFNVMMNFFENPKRFDNSIKVNWLDLKSIVLDFQILVVLLPFTLISLYFLFMRKYSSKIEMFLIIMILFGTLVVWLYELFNIYGRYVFVFKLHQSVWIFWNVSSALIVYYFKDKLNFKNIFNAFFLLLFITLLSSSIIYIVVTSITETDKFKPNYGRNYLSIDAAEFIKNNYPDEYEAIKWINQNIKGNHVILEYPGEGYEFYPRPSTFTGLTAFVEWKGHAEQVSLKNTREIAEVANFIYNTTDYEKALAMIKENNIEFIYIGGKEKEVYSLDSVKKLEEMKKVEPVFKNRNVEIFKVL